VKLHLMEIPRIIFAHGGVNGAAAELRGRVNIQDWYTNQLRVQLAPGGPERVAAKFNGNIRVLDWEGSKVFIELGEGLDYAEGFPLTENSPASPGSVLVIDSERTGQLKVSEAPYDKRVAGVVCGARGGKSGVRLGVHDHDVAVALAGRVYCNVDATYGAVVAGDLLTTSPTPAYAMVVKDSLKAHGAILGKAMESLTKGQKGQILVLVTLQ
jgi:hypothetical protein